MKITNNSNRNISEITTMLEDFYPFAQKRMGFDRDTEIIFETDVENAKNVLGKTAYYEPATEKVTVYVDARHPKDIMRSIST